MKELFEDILYTLNQLPNRKVKSKDWTTYDLAKRVEKKLAFTKEIEKKWDKLLNEICNLQE